MIKIYIIAGNIKEALNLANKLKLKYREWSYLYKIEQILGINEGLILKTGTWVRVPNTYEILTYAYLRGINIFQNCLD